MAKVQLTPEEIAAKKIRRSNGWTRFWAIVVALVLVVGASGFVASKAKTARTEAEEALKELAGVCSIAVVKLGARGSLVRKGSEVLKVDALPVRKVIDTTGAGDYFAAGFLYGLTCGYPLEKCGRIASLLSSKVIQVVGAELSPARWRTIRQNIENL